MPKKGNGFDTISKEIEGAMRRECGEGWREKLWARMMKEGEKLIERREFQLRKLARKFYDYQLSFIYQNLGKRFEVSEEVFEVARRELRRSFEYGDEMGMLLFFEDIDDCVVCKEFYDIEWVVQNNLGRPGTPVTMYYTDKKTGQERRSPLGGFMWDLDKIYEKFGHRHEGAVFKSHTHPTVANPSEEDLKYKPACTSIIGFVRRTPELQKLIEETFYQKPRWKTIEEDEHKTIRRRVPFDVDDTLYAQIEEECTPTVRIFYTGPEGELKRLSIYVDVRILE